MATAVSAAYDIENLPTGYVTAFIADKLFFRSRRQADLGYPGLATGVHDIHQVL